MILDEAAEHNRMIAEAPEIGPTRGWVYAVQATGQAPVKIGFTSHDDIGVRLAGLQTGNPNLLQVLATTRATVEDERIVHKAFTAERMCGEWFQLSARVQTFIDHLPSVGVPLALAEALLIGAPMPVEWMGLAVQETRAHLLFCLRKDSTLYAARKAGGGPSIYRQYEMRKAGSFMRFYLVSEVKRWLVEQKIPHRLNNARLAELTLTIAELAEVDRDVDAPPINTPSLAEPAGVGDD